MTEICQINQNEVHMRLGTFSIVQFVYMHRQMSYIMIPITEQQQSLTWKVMT